MATKTSARKPVGRYNNSRGTRAAAPAARQQQQEKTERPPFLKSNDVGNVADLEIIPGTVRGLRGRFGDQIVMDVRCRGRVYSWGINVSSPNIRLLVAKLTEDSAPTINVKTMISQQGRPFIAIDAPEQPVNDEDIPF